MKTFCVDTLGCKVNHYEGEQIAALLRSHGLVESDAAHADLRVVNSCSVTVQAAGKSRQAARRLVRLPLLGPAPVPADPSGGAAGESVGPSRRPRVIVTGCWATSDPADAASLPGVDAVLTHHGDVAAELEGLLQLWQEEQRGGRRAPADSPGQSPKPLVEPPPELLGDDGWMTEAGTPAGVRTDRSKAETSEKVNLQIYALSVDPQPKIPRGTTRLPLLGERQTGRQRAFLKVQDGCDAHCTYCIIPRLRPAPWSKPVEDVVEEAKRLVAAGHVEIVLTGVFLSAYGHATALRRRRAPGGTEPLAQLVDALCTRVPGLRRLRLSSLEPGDLTADLLSALRNHPQIVPHFHLPLQSGSDPLLRRMNRQYTRDNYLRMCSHIAAAFDRPALTTDVIVGFPGETDDHFARTVEVVDRAAIIHVHAFPFSPRPGTAAARWTNDFVRGPVVNQRIELLRQRAAQHSLAFRRQFIGQTVEILAERDESPALETAHGRCERYFDVAFNAPDVQPGDFVRVRVDEVTPDTTRGTCLSVGRPRRGPA
jgi:MiaB/RimO family radical SAM methylthiotransferase